MVPAGKAVRRSLCLEKARDALSAFEGSYPEVGLPVKIESLAERLGFQVVLLFGLDEEFSGLVSVPQRLIGVNGRHHRHRRRFTIGHELAHIFLKHPPESRSTPKEIALYNAEADTCAAELLIPSPVLLQQLHVTKDAARLATVFDVSKEAMTVKLKTFGDRAPAGQVPPSPHQ